MKFVNVVKVGLGYNLCSIGVRKTHKMGIFAEPVHYNQDDLFTIRLRQPFNESIETSIHTSSGIGRGCSSLGYAWLSYLQA